MLKKFSTNSTVSDDHAALAAACEPGVGLCTVVGLEGSFSRRLGSQMAVLSCGTTVGSLADNCLEAQLAADLRELDKPCVMRYGHGSPKIDFRLPCGGGLDVLLDPSPNQVVCRETLAKLSDRQPASLTLPEISPLGERSYLPSLRIVAFGEGPEIESFERLAEAMPITIDIRGKGQLSLGKTAVCCSMDQWTAVVLLFHDHEWEGPLIEQALASDAFYIGAQGGAQARTDRFYRLVSRGIPEEEIARIRNPIGLIPACKTPDVLALSVLAEVVGAYENLRDTSA